MNKEIKELLKESKLLENNIKHNIKWVKWHLCNENVDDAIEALQEIKRWKDRLTVVKLRLESISAPETLAIMKGE